MASEADIKKMKRGELNALATEYGLNPDDYSRADDLKTAIFDYLKEESKATTEKNQKADTEKSETTDDKVETSSKKAPKANPPRPRIERRSKRYRSAVEKTGGNKERPLDEAIKVVKEASTVKFDASVEIHVNLGVDPKQSDQLIRGSVVLPHGSGKTQKVAALVPDELKDKAKKAGADEAGNETLLKKIEKGTLDFDILVAHPDMMRDLSKHAKTLGPQGLMPSPKAGTVTTDIEKTVKELKAGRIEYRVDRYGIIHQIVGRVSFDDKQLRENVEALMSVIRASKPSSTKGVYLKKVTLTSSMGPAVKVPTSEF